MSILIHIILIGTSLSQILQRLDNYQYIYQEIDCLYTLYKHRFFPSIVTSSGEVFNQLSCGIFLARMDIPIQVWHMVEVMRRDFSEHHITQVPPSENQLGEMQMMEEMAEHVGMNYPETPDSRYVAQPFDDFLFPWEEGSVDNPITIEKDEGFSEPRIPVSEPPRQPSVMDARPALRSIENLQSFDNSAARQLFDL